MRKNWQKLSLSDLERFKKEAGYKDFTKLNALRIASRIWISEKGANLQKCVEKSGQPYVLLGYFLGALRIDAKAGEIDALFNVKPNTLLFLAIKENLCGKEYERYKENFPPFIVKLQYVEPLVKAIKSGLANSNSDIRKKPWLIVYRAKTGGKMFEAGLLEELPDIEELKEFSKIEQFKKLIEEYSLELQAKVKVISPQKFDEAYREAFKDLIEAYELEMQNLEKQELNEYGEDEDLEGIDF